MYGIEWNDEMTLGFKEIDEQHKQLVQTMSDLNQAIIEKRENKVLLDTFDRLFEYALKHFSLEEAYFDKFKYAESERHKASHVYFAKTLDEKYRKINANTRELSVDLIGFLDIWLVGHVLTMDKAYEKCFREHGLK